MSNKTNKYVNFRKSADQLMLITQSFQWFSSGGYNYSI